MSAIRSFGARRGSAQVSRPRRKDRSQVSRAILGDLRVARAAVGRPQLSAGRSHHNASGRRAQQVESSVVRCAHGARIFKTRSPKLEIRNKSKTQISKARNTIDRSSTRRRVAACVRACVLDIRVSDFVLVSDFGFRVSDFTLRLVAAGGRVTQLWAGDHEPLRERGAAVAHPLQPAATAPCCFRRQTVHPPRCQPKPAAEVPHRLDPSFVRQT